MSLYHKLKLSNSYFFATWWCRPSIFQTKTILSNTIDSLKYLRSTTLGGTDIGIRKSEFVAKTQFLWMKKRCKHLVRFNHIISRILRNKLKISPCMFIIIISLYIHLEYICLTKTIFQENTCWEGQPQMPPREGFILKFS